ncbi:nicotianamine synthase family protein [Methanosarcina sp. Z-7115]|uniref:Nicotianamine synthase family protein n=1 Tax=Methanosarcina baikalica TaxID=3073890 RepID=A0ABU2D133_9EURY|nr:nicotianamine synthase family protein [Methanosarcina sp. Z-7115]MDR7665704.1 nicotianamine synthase family protein [Methanosarcina sp. Z-7115]
MVSAVNESLELSESLLGEMLELYRDIRGLSDEEILYCSSDRTEKLFRKLDSLITLDLKSDVACTLLNKRELEPVFTHMNRFRNLYTVRLETEYAKEILASQSPWNVLEEFPFYRNYLRLVRTEYEGFGLKAGNRVFFLGSGPLPLTLIVFLKHYRVKGTGIEQDPARARLSIKVLDKLGLSDDITVINGNHLSLNSIDFINPDTGTRALMIAAQAEPKKEILDHLLKVVPLECRISYRIYEKGLMKLLNMGFLLDLPEGFEKQKIQPEPPTYNTVVFLEKKR